MSRKELVAAVAIVVGVTGASFALVFGLARSGDVVPARPFTPEVKRALVAQLEGALAERQSGDLRAMGVYLSRARDLAKTYGQSLLAAQLVVHGSCGLGVVNWQLARALEIARRAPTVAAVKRRPRGRSLASSLALPSP